MPENSGSEKQAGGTGFCFHRRVKDGQMVRPWAWKAQNAESRAARNRKFPMARR
ncbi:hypothetical protein [Noviherbaspirillum sp.]|uniref:hypothetical protein n=1 Tax=Noviherbaspirillum sp. TaxID=1926288 RepID=UPI002D402DEB|nr:hypothetical protein [Noviherbaspirillum sp.]HZW20350.1 hypothetical protein [Noviherbaspirillum sp.]